MPRVKTMSVPFSKRELGFFLVKAHIKSSTMPVIAAATASSGPKRSIQMPTSSQVVYAIIKLESHARHHERRVTHTKAYGGHQTAHTCGDEHVTKPFVALRTRRVAEYGDYPQNSDTQDADACNGNPAQKDERYERDKCFFQVKEPLSSFVDVYAKMHRASLAQR